MISRERMVGETTSLPYRAWSFSLVSESPVGRLGVMNYRIVFKRSWFWRALSFITHGAFDNYVTTIGTRIYVPPGWSYSDSTIEHECTHITQYRWCGLGSAWLGTPLFLLLYLLVLPLGLNPFRFFTELYAYRADVKAAINPENEAKRIVDYNLTGKGYLWPMPPLGFIRRWAYRFYERKN